MTAVDLISSLEGVRARGHGKWSAKCPAHADTSPSLTVKEGDRGILMKCFAGCSLEAITGKLGLRLTDLFFDSANADSTAIRAARRQRAQALAAQRAAKEAEGRRLDCLREAENLIQSARGISIEEWSDNKLNTVLDRIGAAYQLLEKEGQR